MHVHAHVQLQVHVRVRVRVRVFVFVFVLACCCCCRCGLWWRRERTKRTMSQLIPLAVSLRIAETEQPHQAQRMIGGIGIVLLLTFSQTEKLVRSIGFFGGPLGPSDDPMDLAYMCVKPQMRLYVCHQMRLHVCHQMRLYVCHQMRLLNPQRNGARFARLPLLASLARFFNSLN